ncbi:hypothetical protein N7G274_000272 [Stereocaulon virgatum]|uniref:Uncharacterized protein n=1 Tax=Stereocaulon virgatum TaxID=373712 RepID=A0ABR4AUF0_9LECA
MACNIDIPRPTSSDENDSGSAKIEGFKVVASYNWLDEPTPTILVQLPAAAQGSTSHHRIVTYEFGGMRFLVRYAVDAYLHGRAEALMRTEGIQIARLGPLVDWALSRGLSAAAPSSTLPHTTPVTVITGGHNIPHASTLELVTRAKNSKTPFRLQSKLSSLWISQTQNLVTAFHQNAHTGRSKFYGARYDDVKVEDVGIMVNEWEGANQMTLRKLITCLKRLIEVAKELKGACIVHHEGTGAGSLRISFGEVPSLPREMQCLFHRLGDMEVTTPVEGIKTQGSGKKSDMMSLPS